VAAGTMWWGSAVEVLLLAGIRPARREFLLFLARMPFPLLPFRKHGME
jgi:hypothetical protein